MVLNSFKSRIFSIKPIEVTGCPDMLDRVTTVFDPEDRSNLKILSHKQVIQRLPIALAEVKAGNTSNNFLNKIRQIIYSLYLSKEITKKCTPIKLIQ